MIAATNDHDGLRVPFSRDMARPLEVPWSCGLEWNKTTDKYTRLGYAGMRGRSTFCWLLSDAASSSNRYSGARLAFVNG